VERNSHLEQLEMRFIEACVRCGSCWSPFWSNWRRASCKLVSDMVAVGLPSEPKGRHALGRLVSHMAKSETHFHKAHLRFVPPPPAYIFRPARGPLPHFAKISDHPLPRARSSQHRLRLRVQPDAATRCPGAHAIFILCRLRAHAVFILRRTRARAVFIPHRTALTPGPATRAIFILHRLLAHAVFVLRRTASTPGHVFLNAYSHSIDSH
jgi:hypothetical protein